MTPRVSVIVPHLNQPALLEHCLASLDRQSLDRANFEVLVVDNGSTQLPTETVARHPGTQLLEEKRPGPGIARNRGAASAGAAVLAFIDADCRADPDWLKNGLAAIETAPRGVVLGGDVRIWREGDEMSAIQAYESVFAYRFKLYIEQHGFSGTGNLMVRREDYDAVGPFAGIDARAGW